jgi:putative endonuclease
MSLESRRRARAYGRMAEQLCAFRLRLAGWRIVARDYRTAVGEIDIIARRGRVLAFIEVKARRDGDDAPDALMPRQRDRIVRAAERFLQTMPRFAEHDLRIDVMLVGGRRWPRHIRDAWRPEA